MKKEKKEAKKNKNKKKRTRTTRLSSSLFCFSLSFFTTAIGSCGEFVQRHGKIN